MVLKNAPFVDESVDPREKLSYQRKKKLIRGRVISSYQAKDIEKARPFERIQINRLITKELAAPLDAVVEADGEGYIARNPDLPLYGYGDDIVEAIDHLKEEIETLYEELMEDDNFTEEWFRIKAFLKKRIIEG